MFTVTVRDHMMIAHSLRGDVFGPAQRLHGATFVVDASFAGNTLDDNGIVVDIGLATQELRTRSSTTSGTATSTTTRRSPGGTPRPRCWPGRSPTGWPRGCTRRRVRRRPGADLSRLTVTLHESHVAWASYERDLWPD